MKVVTYGTFDLSHEGHVRLLKRAKALGDHLTVGVTAENYDDARGKLNVQQRLMDRIRNVQDSGLADEVIIEEYEGQKVNDLQEYSIDVFAIGSDWRWKFDYLGDYCQVVYLERREGISSTALRAANFGILKLGVVGTGRIAKRFMEESHFVSGVQVEGVFSRTAAGAETFRDGHKLQFAAQDFDELLSRVDAVYIATPHEHHVDYALRIHSAGKHLVCEAPRAQRGGHAMTARDRRSTRRGAARSRPDCLLTRIPTPGGRGPQQLHRGHQVGGCDLHEAGRPGAGARRRTRGQRLGAGQLSPAGNPEAARTRPPGRAHVLADGRGGQGRPRHTHRPPLPHAVASARVGLEVKTEGDLVITCTQGYVYVPAPWWKTEYFETRFEDPRMNNKSYYKFDGDGLRCGLAKFASMAKDGVRRTFKLTPEGFIAISDIIEEARTNEVEIR